MLLGGGGGCQGCGCKSCQECTRTCTNPHTGTAFEVYYTYKFEGVEAGNPGQVATGDADSSDPYDGMDGTGPWEQKVSFGFELTSSTTRHPCNVSVSFWRSNFVLGAATNPPPSAALTLNEIKITNSGSSIDGPVITRNGVLNPGEQTIFEGEIPLVAGSGDQSDNDPRSGSGTVSFIQACGNQRAKVDISATIRWATQKRQHILYGIVRECYEDPENPPCATICSGSPPPAAVYMTVSNVQFALSSGSSLPSWWNNATSGLAATYVLDRLPFQCDYYELEIEPECIGWYMSILFGYPRYASLLFASGSGRTVQFNYSNDVILQTTDGQKCESVILTIPGNSIGDNDQCALPKSGSNGSIYREPRFNEVPVDEKVGTFSWSIDD